MRQTLREGRSRSAPQALPMPEDTIRLEVAVPDRLVLNEDTVSVQLPLTTGYAGVLPGHAPFLAEVGTGVLTYAVMHGSEEHLAIDGGAVEILPDRVRVLAERAERADEIDAERARKALERADERLQLSSFEIDVDRAQKALARAKARIAIAKRQ
ncbi:MAG: ATP synthase F1 subunit epsilon [Acidobacteriia bacterium]|nr:ATP synthase F1 subunit epsilon [Terriglobia bacterium]